MKKWISSLLVLGVAFSAFAQEDEDGDESFGRSTKPSASRESAPRDSAPRESARVATESHYQYEVDHASLTFIPAIGIGSGMMSLDSKGSETLTALPGLALQASVLTEMGAGGVSFQTGLIYLRETGNFYSSSLGSGFGSASMTSDQIGVPLLAKFNFDRATRRFSLKAGVIPAYLIGVNVETDFGGSKQSQSSDRSYLRSWNAVALIAAGVEIPRPSGNDLRLELSYDRGLLTLNEDADGGKIYAQSVLFSVGMGVAMF